MTDFQDIWYDCRSTRDHSTFVSNGLPLNNISMVTKVTYNMDAILTQFNLARYWICQEYAILLTV
jgi:hypothetical protein